LFSNILKPSEKKKKESEKEALRSAQTIQNEAMLDLLKQLVDDAKFALNNNDHKKVVQILQNIILHDLNLRKIINGQLMDKVTVAQMTLQNSIELESYYTLTRSKIIISVVDSIVSGLNDAKKFFMSNNDYAVESYNYFKQVYDYYMGGLAFLLIDKEKDQEQKMYQECKIAFDAVEASMQEFFPNLQK
jgi:hypothetical protein